MKPFNETARCPKCDYDASRSVYWDGKYDFSTFCVLDNKNILDNKKDIKRYEKLNETAHLRECIKRTCSRCEFSWDESVVTKP